MQYKLLTCVITCLILTGCQTPNGIKTALNVNTAAYLNPDINGNAAPLMISVFELKTPVQFEQANYQQLSSNSAQTLGTALIDKQYYEIQPGMSQHINQYITTNTRYIGIIASYRNIDQASWRKVLTVPQSSSHLAVNINLESQSLSAHIKG